MSAASMVIAAQAQGRTFATASARVVDVTTYGADPTGAKDSTSAFNQAAAAIAPNGGVMYVPPGGYLLTKTVTLGRGVTIRGEGSTLSVLMINHSVTALNFTFAVNSYYDGSATSVVEKIGFLPMVAGGIAIAMNAPLVSSSGWPTCRIEDVDFTRPGSTSSGFAGNIYLNNVWRSIFRNLDVSNATSKNVAGSYFVFLTGQSIDNVFEKCRVTGVQTMFALSTPSNPNGYAPIQGVHITDSVGANVDTAVDSGLSLLNGYNVLGFYVSGCEFDAKGPALNLSQISGGYVANSHMEISNTNAAAINFSGCEYVHVNDCSLSGTAGGTGIAFAATQNLPCKMNQANSCEFIDFSTQISFAASNGGNSVASNIALNCAFAVNGATSTLAQVPVLVDNNSPTTNQVEWFTTQSGTGRTGFLH